MFFRNATSIHQVMNIKLEINSIFLSALNKNKMKTVYHLLSALFIIGIIAGCSGSKKSNQSENITMSAVKPASRPGPQAIIYKTSGDYNNNVPVILNDEKTKIVSFPDPADLRRGGELTLPDELANGFLLDNRGINEHVAFLSLNYEEYVALDKIPNAEEMMGLVIDVDPLIVMYDCGLRSDFKDISAELNQAINSESLGQYVQLK